jgi:N-acetylglucosaminyldiphosphoundecaprenol N-acetyl-beta-D-mannosaminyltransferase
MNLCGVNISTITLAEVVQKLDEPQIIFTPNPEILLEAERNPEFKEALSCGTLMLPDGHGLQIVSTLMRLKSRFLRMVLYFPSLLLYLFWKAPFKKVIPEIIHGSDFTVEVCSWAAKREKSVFFLGARAQGAEKTAEFFSRKFPNLCVAGFSNLDPSEEALEAVLKSKADVLFVAYGAPKQEMWVNKWRKELKGVHTVMTVGGSFDFYSGDVKRAPALLRKLGLEWVWRLVRDPVGRSRRIWDAVVKFPLMCLCHDFNKLQLNSTSRSK